MDIELPEQEFAISSLSDQNHILTKEYTLDNSSAILQLDNHYIETDSQLDFNLLKNRGQGSKKGFWEKIHDDPFIKKESLGWKISLFRHTWNTIEKTR